MTADVQEPKTKITAVFGKDNIPVEITGVRNERGWYEVKAVRGEPFTRYTHGGWAAYDTAFAPHVLLKDLRVDGELLVRPGAEHEANSLSLQREASVEGVQRTH